MRVVFALILVSGGLWLGWLVLTGLPFPWDQPGGTAVNTTGGGNSQESTVTPAGAATPGSTGGVPWGGL